MAEPNAEERQTTLELIGARIRELRTAARLSPQQLSTEIGISEQQLRRIEAGKHEPGVLKILKIVQLLKADLGAVAPRWQSEEEHTEELWREHDLSRQLPGTASLDYRAKKAILVSRNVWRPVQRTRPYIPPELQRAGLVDCLPNKSALRDVLAKLPAATTMVLQSAISGTQSLDEERVLGHLADLAKGETRVEFLLLSPKQRVALEQRAKEMAPDRDAEAIGHRITSELSRIDNTLVRVAPKNVSVLFYDTSPRWRILIVDDRAYVTYYPPDKPGDRAPVLVYQADRERLSAYWAYLDGYAVCRSNSHLLNRKVVRPGADAQEIYASLAAQIDGLLPAAPQR